MQAESGPLDDLIGHSITYRIAVGPREGQKLFTLQTVPAREPEPEQQGDHRGALNAAGFSLTPAHRGVGSQGQGDQATDKPITPRHVAMTWAQRLKRVFGIEINTCTRCGGQLKVIASIEEPEVIAKILAHIQKIAPDPQQAELPLGARAPLTQALLI